MTPIDLLKKAFLQATHTSDALQPWEEPLDRFNTVYQDQVVAAQPVPLELGAWVSSGGYPYQSVTTPSGSIATQETQSGLATPSRELIETNPGMPGYSDLDFVPYNYGTNRFGSKGGALSGHPISWEVVGPTLKSPYCHWQWSVTFNGAGVDDVLTLANGPLSNTFLNGGALPTVAQAYGLSGTIADYDESGGLYILVTFTAEGMDGALKAPGVSVTNVDPLGVLTSTYELFRVSGFSGQTLSLKASKKLGDYFASVAGTPTIRGITVIRPKVTRLVAFPHRIVATQANQVYVFVPPSTSATSEYMPPYVGGTGAVPNCPSWVDGGFAFGTTSAGSSSGYGSASRLPVPKPISTFTASVPVGAPAIADEWVITASFPGGVVPLAKQIVRVSTLEQKTINHPSSVFGWFEIDTVGGAGPFSLTLKRVPEVDPSTGSVFYGDGPYCSGTSDQITGELYDNVDSLFNTSTLDLTKLGAARITNLIDPRKSEFSNKGMYATVVNGTAAPSYSPDKSIFDTRGTSDNPGNLMDLGFRVVLFPAKKLGAGIGPDFDNPIDTNNVRLNSDYPNEAQYLEIDYSAGVLYLSHPPKPGVGCDVAPNGIIADPTNNPRNEVVLYASCVPVSREVGQTGSGVRVLTSSFANAVSGFGPEDLTDLMGSRVILTPDIPGGPVVPSDTLTFVGSPIGDTAIPSSGFFLLYELDPVSFVFTSGEGPFFYPYYNPTGSGSLVNIAFPQGGPANYTVTSNTRLVMFKSGTRFLNSKTMSDGARGSSKRVSTLAFKNVLATYGVDGTVTLESQPTVSLDYAYRMGSVIPGAGRSITVDGGAVELFPLDATAGGDQANASFRVDCTASSDQSGLVGVEVVSSTGPSDPFAGFMDRRVFAPSSGPTILSDGFSIEYSSPTKIKISAGPNKFWTAGAYMSSLLQFGGDLITVFDLTTRKSTTYVINTYGATGDEVEVLNMDGSIPTFTPAATGTATVYRVKFQTGRGDSGSLPNVNTWIRGQHDSGFGGPFSFAALNLYAGSSTATSPSDGGGTTTAMAFWSRYNIFGSESTFPATNFDTFGRYTSYLTGFFMAGGAKQDYYYRGDYITRGAKDLGPFGAGLWSVGHVIDEQTKGTSRYDFLSLSTLVDLSYQFSFLATTPTKGVIEVDPVGPPLPPDVQLLPYGAAIVEIISTTPSTAVTDGVLGLYLLRGYNTGGTGHQLVIRDLAGNIPSNLPGAGTTGVLRLYVFSSQGFKADIPYYDTYTSSNKLQSPTMTVGVGLETTAVGLSISGTSRLEPLISGADRYALRVTTADGALAGDTQPGNRVVAGLDLDGFYQGGDYLYQGGPKTVTKDLNLAGFNSVVNSATPGWFLSINTPAVPQTMWWEASAINKVLLIPVPLPASALRGDTLGISTHLATLLSVDITGYFYGSLGNEATIALALQTNNYVAGSTTLTYQLVSGATSSILPVNAGPQTTTNFGITNAGGGPMVIDNETQTLVLQITSNNDGLTPRDQVYGVRLTWKDPGPRNY